MTYVDGYVLPVPKKNISAYKKMAGKGARLWKKHGALQYFECVGEDLTPNTGEMIATFKKLMDLKPNETAIFAFVVFKSRSHRDQVNAKVFKDPSMNDPSHKNKPMPFDMKRMAYGGFKTMVQK